MSLFDEAPNYTLTPAQRKAKSLRDHKWRKAAAARKLWSAEEQAAERLRLQKEIDAKIDAKIAAKRAA